MCKAKLFCMKGGLQNISGIDYIHLMQPAAEETNKMKITLCINLASVPCFRLVCLVLVNNSCKILHQNLMVTVVFTQRRVVECIGALLIFKIKLRDIHNKYYLAKI